MTLRLGTKGLLMLGSAILFMTLAFSGASKATISAQTAPTVIEYGDDGFSIRNLTVTVGTTVTWRNQSDRTLNLRGSAFQYRVTLPLIMAGGAGANAALTAASDRRQGEPASPANGFDVTIEPGGEYSHQLTVIGRFQFMDLLDHNARGVIVVAPLTRIYAGDDGSALYLRTVGNEVYGFGEHPGEQYAYVLSGHLGDNHISASFWDVPKGTRTNDGDVLLNVFDGGAQLALESGSTEIGPASWVEVTAGSFNWPPMTSAGFQKITPNNITGAFVGDDYSRHYIRQVDDESVVWVAEAPAQPDERPAWVSVFVGEIDALALIEATGSYADVPKGLANEAGTFEVETSDERTLDLAQTQVNRASELEPDYVVDWDVFENTIVDALDGNAIGYAYAIGKGQGLMRSDAGGYRLLAVDGGPEAFTEHTLGQAFSTSKTMTAVAMVRALDNRNLSVDAFVAPFLPDCWVKGEGIDESEDGLTFGELLNHHSGLTQPSNSDPYFLLKELVEEGRTGPQGYNYNNVAYGLMRYLVPLVANEAEAMELFAILDCEDEDDGATINEELSTMFGEYLFGMLDLVDVEATFFAEGVPDPTRADVAYLYNRNFEWQDGIGPNPNGWLRAGAGYIATSIRDYRRFLGALDQGLILPEPLVQSMYEDHLGFDHDVDGAAGTYYQKDGAATGNCGAGGKAQLMVYPSGIHSYIMMNSVTHGNPADWEYDHGHNAGASDEIIADWGESEDLPIAGDFDRDGLVDDVAVFRPSNQTWYYDYNHNGGFSSDDAVVWGASGDLPIAGDFNADGYVDDVAVYRPTTQTWFYDYYHDGGTPDEVVRGWGEDGDRPLAGDFDRDGYVDDVAVFRHTSRDWYYDYDHDGGDSDEAVFNWGASGDWPIAGDFNRDGFVDDVAVFRPSNQTWYYDYHHNGGSSANRTVAGWGESDDLPLAGDFDQDGDIDDVAVFRPASQNWYYDYNHNGTALTDEAVSGWGFSGDIPIAGDFDRDGRVDDVAVFRPWSRDWYYDYNHDGGNSSDEVIADWGRDGDLPIAGDFDRDGYSDDVAVFRPSEQTWYYDYDHDGGSDEVVAGWGASGDLPLAGDFNRDGYADDVAVYQPSTRTWFYDYHHDGRSDEEVAGWGAGCDVPIAGDFDRDGEVDDVGVFRLSNGRWYYDYDHDGGETADEAQPAWGNGAGLPLAGDFDSDGLHDDVAFFRNTGLHLVGLLRTAFDDALIVWDE